MPRIRVSTGSSAQIDKLEEIIKKTEIIKKEFELEYGVWKFAVIGRGEGETYTVREGNAKTMLIQSLPLYCASAGPADLTDVPGIPVEEFIGDDVPPELRGLSIYNIDPVRPLTITKKYTVTGDRKIQKLIDEYSASSKNAILLSPDDRYWFISVLKYLNECDEDFPDQFIQGIRNRHFSSRPGTQSSGFPDLARGFN